MHGRYTVNEPESRSVTLSSLLEASLLIACSLALTSWFEQSQKVFMTMANIHVNLDEMRQLAGSFEWWSNNLRDNMVPTLQNLAGQLEGDWQGVSRQRYDQLIQVWQSNARNLINSAEDLRRHLMNTARISNEAQATRMREPSLF